MHTAIAILSLATVALLGCKQTSCRQATSQPVISVEERPTMIRVISTQQADTLHQASTSSPTAGVPFALSEERSSRSGYALAKFAAFWSSSSGKDYSPFLTPPLSAPLTESWRLSALSCRVAAFDSITRHAIT